MMSLADLLARAPHLLARFRTPDVQSSFAATLARRSIQSRPVRAVFCAIGVGFLAGAALSLLLPRRRRSGP